jgi:coenzyme F420 biosynthesis associated uncharacterized protein
MKRRDQQRALMGLGMLAGAALVGAYATKRRRIYTATGAPPLINWARVRRIAEQMNPETGATAEWHASWGAYYTALVRQCEPLIAEEIGQNLPQPVQEIAAFSRAEWVDANIRNFQMLFEPLEDLHRSGFRVDDLLEVLLGDVNQTMVSAELGIMLGYLARRVLGQYDLSLLGREPVTSAGRLYFVEPNIGGVQQELSVAPEEFRLWIALHETTHAFEFEAYPWLRAHFNGLIESYFKLIIDDLALLREGLGGLSGLVVRARQNMAQGDSWIEAVMNPEQRGLFDQLQALMAVVEGYSNYIMNTVGERLLPSYEHIKQQFEARAARRSPAEKLFIRLTGLELKMEQYRLGEAFINAVVAQAGVAMANRMWEGPAALPTLAELRNPPAWIARMEGLPTLVAPTTSLDTTLL